MLTADDWYNRWAIETGNDDFRFLYLGEDLSFTPLHHDVCMSHSWSTSLCGNLTPGLLILIVGTKVWTLIPPEYAEHLPDHKTGTIPKFIDETFEKVWAAAIVVTQLPGETIFVPSGWYHQVINHGFHLSNFV